MTDKIGVIPPGLNMGTPETYVHYKGGRYMLLCVAIHEKDGTKMCVYASLNGDDGRVFVRSFYEFFGNVSYQGKTVPRFKKED